VDARRRLSASDLERACTAILLAADVPTDEVALVVHSLLLAELMGHASHGVSRLPTYVQRVQAGLICTGRPARLVRDSTCLLAFDGQAGFGHVVGARAMAACVERARETGLAAATVSNSSHFGIAGAFALQAVDAGMIGVAMSNAAAKMPPQGGRTPVLGTNPLAVAIPTSGPYPILLDMATSAIALGKVLLAQAVGHAIPAGLALTAEGDPTTDAAAAAAGLLLPMGGPKGFGLALVLEVFSAVLSGASIGRDVGSMYRSWDRSEDLGHFFLALDPSALLAREEFLARVERLAAQVRSSELLPGVEGVYLPGELEFRRADEARRDGLVFTDALRADLQRAADCVGVRLEI
jgi:LDH2 family malate/lactate/ureidoglycolate dehydrogenase